MRKGTVEQRHGRSCTGGKRCGCPWRYRVDDREGVNGKRVQATQGGFPTKTKALEALAEAQRRIGNGEFLGPSPTVESHLDNWLNSKEGSWKPATIAQYRDLTRRFLVPHLGRVKLSQLRAEHVEAMLTAMTDEGRGYRTRHLCVAVLSSALGVAMKRRLVPWNVCSQLELPREYRERPDFWDEDQTRAFLKYVQSDRLSAMWRVFALYGLRRGEVLGLHWAEVDLDDATLRVVHTLSEIGGHLVWGTPKSRSGLRTLPLDSGTVAALRAHRSHQAAEKLALGEAYKDEGLVFARQDGGPTWPGTVSARFRKLIAAAGLPRIPLHGLRHMSASLMLASGVDLKTVSANHGHAGITITADLYAHVLPSVARDAAEKVAAFVSV